MSKIMTLDSWRRCHEPPISSKEVNVWSVFIVSIAYWANIARASSSDASSAFWSAVQAVFDNGLFDVFAWILVFTNVGGTVNGSAASWRQVRTAFLVGVVVLIPVRIATAAALVIMSLDWIRDPIGAGRRRVVGLILLALALEIVWLSPLSTSLHLFVAQLDANISVILLNSLGMVATAHGNVVDNVTMGFSITIWPYCSSSMPLCGVVLAFIAMTTYLRQSPRRGHLPWLAMSIFASIGLTEIRLMLLATGPDSYDLWHDGAGASVHSMVALGLAVLFPVLAARVSGRTRAFAGDRGIA
jgi:hypothetical protein